MIVLFHFLLHYSCTFIKLQNKSDLSKKLINQDKNDRDSKLGSVLSVLFAIIAVFFMAISVFLMAISVFLMAISVFFLWEHHFIINIITEHKAIGE